MTISKVLCLWSLVKLFCKLLSNSFYFLTKWSNGVISSGSKYDHILKNWSIILFVMINPPLSKKIIHQDHRMDPLSLFCAFFILEGRNYLIQPLATSASARCVARSPTILITAKESITINERRGSNCARKSFTNKKFFRNTSWTNTNHFLSEIFGAYYTEMKTHKEVCKDSEWFWRNFQNF